MALDTVVLRNRLREAFGSDPQDVVAKKLNMTQGSISKILSGNQQPTLETIYHVSEAYSVSVDWLLGLSEKKRVTKYQGETTYAEAVETLGDVIKKGAVLDNDQKGGSTTIAVGDPLLKMLLKKNKALIETDRDLHTDWVDTKLALFADKPLLYTGDWTLRAIDFLVSEAVTESNWLEVYDAAVEAAKDFADMMGDDVSPFKG